MNDVAMNKLDLELPISYMMTKSVVTANTEDTVESVEQLCHSHHLTSVPVTDSDGAIFGIISASDLLRFHSEHKNPKAVHAWELCTHKPVQVAPTASVIEVAKLMTQHKIHHMIVSENGLIVGFVSSADFLKKIASASNGHTH